MRIQDMDITNYGYDGSSTTDGEPFAPADVNMRRFVYVQPIVVGTGSASTTAMEGVNATWDKGNNNIHLFHSGGGDGEMAEMTKNNDEGAEVRLICVGV
jgi:hypothetical protein